MTREQIRARRVARSRESADRRELYTGEIITLDTDTVRFPDGSTGEFDMIRHPGASAVVPFLSDPAATIRSSCCIKQYRYAADGYMYEIPAGRLDAGESPATAPRAS